MALLLCGLQLFIYRKMSAELKNPPFEVKALIHHVLHRHNVYQLQMGQLRELLQLLQQTSNETPLDLQHKLFLGVLAINLQHGDTIAPYLSQREFSQISLQAKTLLHKVLHEFGFLYSIRAQQMFVSQFQQSLAKSAENKLLFDDSLERSKVHQLYYGPLNSLYQGLSNPQPYIDHFQPQNPPLPSHQPQNPPLPPHQPPSSSLLPQNNHSPSNYVGNGYLPSSNSLLQQPLIYGYGGLDRRIDYEPPIRPRGRPPKNRDPKNAQENSKLRQKQESRHEQGRSFEKIPESRSHSLQVVPQKVALQNCICKGSISGRQTFRCKCDQMFHVECMGSSKSCLVCRQIGADPFWKCTGNLQSFHFSFEHTEKVELEVDLAKAWTDSRPQGYELMLSCGHPSEEGVCYPDDTLFAINNQPVFEAPALLQAHRRAKRNDKALVVTPYVDAFSSFDPSSLCNLKLSLLVRKLQQEGEEIRRNNRKGTFVLCLFVAKRVTPDELLREVLQQNTNVLKIGPFKWPFLGQVEPDRQQISLLDPFSGQVIEYPVRGVACRHLQCFDLKTFLSLTFSSSSRLWKCPFCQKEVQRLLLDKYQLEMLGRLRMTDSVPRRVIFFSSGAIDYQYQEAEELECEQKMKAE